MPLRLQLSGDVTQRPAVTIHRVPCQLLRQRDRTGIALKVVHSPATLSGLALLSLSSAAQFSDQRGLFELAHGAQHLPDKDRRRLSGLSGAISSTPTSRRNRQPVS